MPEFKNLSELLKSNPTEQDCINYYEKVILKGEMLVSPFDPPPRKFTSVPITSIGAKTPKNTSTSRLEQYLEVVTYHYENDFRLCIS